MPLATNRSLLSPAYITHTLANVETSWHAAETTKVVQFIARELPRLSDAISVSYFAHSTISRTGRGDEK